MKVRSLIVLIVWLSILTACDFKLKPFSEIVGDTVQITIQRYDRLESLYLTTGDFSALQQMSTDYPNETRTLIENVLGLGDVSDPQINSKLLRFYQDSTLQTVISDAEVQYANMSDLNAQLTDAFHTLKTWIPDIKVDKHFTGGVGDKVTITAKPIASACGIQKIKKNIIKI